MSLVVWYTCMLGACHVPTTTNTASVSQGATMRSGGLVFISQRDDNVL